LKKPYKLEILWENGVLTEIDISETEKETTTSENIEKSVNAPANLFFI